MTTFYYFTGGNVNKPYGEALKSNSQIYVVYDKDENDGKPIERSVLKYQFKSYASHLSRSNFVVGDSLISSNENFERVVAQQSPDRKYKAGDDTFVQHIAPFSELGLTYIDIKKPIPDGYKITISFKPLDSTNDIFKRDDRVIKSNSPMQDRLLWPNNLSDFTLGGVGIYVTIDIDPDTQQKGAGKADDSNSPATIPLHKFCFMVRQEVTGFANQESCECAAPACPAKFDINSCLVDSTYGDTGYASGCDDGVTT